MMLKRTFSLLLVLLACSWCCAADTKPEAKTEPKPEVKTEVTVEVIQAKASNDGPASIDPALKDLGDLLKRKFAAFRVFKLLSTISHAVSPEHPADFELANKMTLTVKVISVKDKDIDLSLTIPNVMPTATFKIRSGATFLTGVPWNKDKLILAIRPSIP
jgi:hypothetical protein